MSDSSTEPMGLRERNKERRRSTILTCAFELFAERGYNATTIADIAAAADIAPRTVSLYFPTKQDIVLDAMTSLLQALSDALERLREFAQKSPAVGHVRGRGLMFGVDLVTDRETKEPARELAEEVFYRCLDAGLSFKISAGSVLTLSPPLTIAREDLERALTIVEDAIVSAVNSASGG